MALLVALANGHAPAADPVRQLSLRSALWGREAYVPDWRHGNAADAEATRYFLEHRLPGLEGWPGSDGGNAATSSGAPPEVTVFHVEYWAGVLPGFVPPAPLGDDTRHLTAARGESEPFALGVRLRGEGATVRVRVGAFVGQSARISEDDTSVRLMLPYRARAKAGRRRVGHTVHPMVLLAPEDGAWALPPDYAVAFVVDVHVPLDAPPGRYRTQVDVLVGEHVARSVPVELEVLPFALKVNGFHAGAFGTTHDLWAGGFTGYYPEMTEMDSRYGFNLAGGFFNKGNELPFARDESGALVLDERHEKFERFDRLMQRLVAHGMGGVAFWNWGATGNVKQFDKVLLNAGAGGPIATAAGKRAFADMICALHAAGRARGWPELVVNPFDEALKDQDATREVIEAMPALRQRCPDARVYMTEWRPGYTRHYQSTGRHLRGEGRPREAEMRRLLESGEPPRLNFAVIGANTLDGNGRALQDKLGGEFWHYTGVTRLGAQGRFAFGFKPWIRRSEAVLMWANYKGTLLDEGWTLHHVLSRDPNGRRNRNTRGPVVPSVRALAVREGVDDRKYIETLRYHAVRLDSRMDLAFLAALQREAAALLLNARSIGGIDNVEARILSGEALEALRTRIRQRIVRLLEAEAALRGPR